jgi:4-hydroxy-2-oxoheptanedioate aldolase
LKETFMTRKTISLLLCIVVAVFTLTVSGQGGDPNYKPKRLNKMIELLEAGQPIYDISVEGVGYEEGKKLAQDRYDLIQYQMEHGPFDPILLRQFMQGLVDGGPTKSGHRTPTVIVTLPVLGLDEATVKANHWAIEQILTSGVHGLMMCHMRNPEAARMFVATARYQFERPNLKGADKGIPEGLRGSGSQTYASRIWGIPANEYVVKADPWPMNPEGELILSVKMEDKYALANVEQITKVPGIAWGEWGPGDQSMSLVGLPAFLGRRGGGGGDDAAGGGRGRGGRGRGVAASNEPVAEGLPPIADARLQAAREKIMNTMKAAKWFTLHSATEANIEQLIRAGVMVTHGSSLALTNKGRAYTKRQMPY